MVGHKGETSVVGCKVLPLCDVMSTRSNSGESSDAGDQKIEGRKSEKRYGVSRMKELIRRAVAAKAQRVGVRAWKVGSTYILACFSSVSLHVLQESILSARIKLINSLSTLANTSVGNNHTLRNSDICDLTIGKPSFFIL